mmetsp:Transcript_40949/g.162152  ORF Transcript_40949/g.162152 Transcript_40949/m.162152 type:complete len:120 (-) Transcript_40949:24-383(-)
MGKRKRALNGTPGDRKRKAGENDETQGRDGLDAQKLLNEIVEKGIERMDNIQTLLNEMSAESLEISRRRTLIHALRKSFAALEDHFESNQKAGTGNLSKSSSTFAKHCIHCSKVFIQLI